MKQYVWMKGYRQLRVGRRSCSGRVYLITSLTMGREPIFANDSYAQTAIVAFTAAALLKDNDLLCWVLMPDHAHWLIQLGSHSTLSNLVGSMKSASARHVRQAGYSNLVWNKGFHDRRLKHNMEIPVAIQYILDNPYKAGLVERGERYLYSSGARPPSHWGSR